MGNASCSVVCGKGNRRNLSQRSIINQKQPYDKDNTTWTTPDITIPSEFISTIDFTPSSVRSTTLEFNGESTPTDLAISPIDYLQSESQLPDDKPKKSVQFDENIQRQERLEFLKKFIEENRNQEDSPLCKAIKEGAAYSFKIIKELVESGEDVNFRDKMGDPILYTALFYEQYNVAKLLIDHGADVNYRNRKWEPIIYTAVQSGKVDIVEKVINFGADVDCRNSKGDPILYTAVLTEKKQIVNLLLQYDADPNVRNTLGISCLEQAMTTNQMDVMKVLVNAGADIDIKDKEGNNLLHVAMMFQQLDGLRMLLDLGADVNIPDIEGNPVLEMAILMKHRAAVGILLANGASVNIKNNRGIPVFHKAVFKKDTDILNIMINSGADIDIQDSMGNTALFRAVERRNSEAITLLLDSGADGNIRNDEERTCLDYAIISAQDKHDVIETLTSSGSVTCHSRDNTERIDVFKKTNRSENKDNYPTFCDRALFLTSIQSEHHIRQWTCHKSPDKYWFCKVNLICDHVHVDCIIDGRLQLAYETLKQITLRPRSEYYRFYTTDVQNEEDSHPFEAEDPRAITEFELLLTTKNKIKDGINMKQTTHEGNSMLHLAVKYKHNCLLRFLLRNDGNIYKRNRRSLSAFKLAIKTNVQNLLIPMSYFLLRDFTCCTKFKLDDISVWLGWKCECKRNCPAQREFCSHNFTIVVESDGCKIPPQFFFKGIDVHFYSQIDRSGEFQSIFETLNETMDSNDETVSVKLPNVDWNQLFISHKNLKFVYPVSMRSVNFSAENEQHQVENEFCIRLVCRCKGIIPSDECHFPTEIGGLKTDCIEDNMIAYVAKKNTIFELISLGLNDNTNESVNCDISTDSVVTVTLDSRDIIVNDSMDNLTVDSDLIPLQRAVFTFSLDYIRQSKTIKQCCV